MSAPAAETTNQDFKLLVDFDATLFDRDAFSYAMLEEMAELTGLEIGRMVTDASKLRTDASSGKVYDFERHVRCYGLSTGFMWDVMNRTLLERDYLFEDSQPFMEGLKADGLEPEILSFGELKYQEAKIKPLLGRLGDVPYTIVNGRKNAHIAARWPGGHGVLVDDVEDQELPEGFVEIHLDRESGLKAPEEKAGGFVVADLVQARQVINELRAA